MRLARWLTRAGSAPSRRAAEAIILAGRVSVNGSPVASPAINVGPDAVVTLDGARVTMRAATQQPLLFIAHKLTGELVSRVDPQGRPTLFDRLQAMGVPPGLMAVGRLDYLTEGLLILTNDGDIARFLTLPASNVPRTYRVRVYGVADRVAAALAAFRRGPVLDGVRFRPALARVLTHEDVVQRYGAKDSPARSSRPASTEASIGTPEGVHPTAEQREGWGGDRDGSAPMHAKASSDGPLRGMRGEAAPGQTVGAHHRRVNAWLEVTLTEGKNREIRRVVEAHGLSVHRLVRVGFGPYTLTGLARGDVLQVSRVPAWILARKPRLPLASGADTGAMRSSHASTALHHDSGGKDRILPPVTAQLPRTERRPRDKGGRIGSGRGSDRAGKWGPERSNRRDALASRHDRVTRSDGGSAAAVPSFVWETAEPRAARERNSPA